MNKELKNIIKKVKVALREEPLLIIAGALNDGAETKKFENQENVKQYYDFLQECDGARCGAIDIFDYELFVESQYRVSYIPGGFDEWLCIGQIVYEPMVLNKNNGHIYLFFQGNETEISPERFSCFDDFLIDYVFGKNYADIVPDANNDEWYIFINEKILNK